MADPKKILEINGQHSDLDNNQSGIKDDGNRAWIHKTLEGNEIESAVKGDVTRQDTFDAGNIVKTDTTDFTVSGDSYYQSANHYLKVAVESGATFDLLFKTDDGKVQFDVKVFSLSSSSGSSLVAGRSMSLKDFYLSSAITLSESGQTALATTSNSLVGAINEVKSSVNLQGAYNAGNVIELTEGEENGFYVVDATGTKGIFISEIPQGGELDPITYTDLIGDVVVLGDQHLDSPVSLSESGQSELATDSQSLVGAINEMQPVNKLNGFDLQVPSSIPDLAFDDTTRVFTASIKSGSSDFYFWCSGLKFSKTSSESVTIPDVTGTYYTYFDNSGTLQYVNQDSVTAPLLYEYAIVGLIYWNATAQESEVGNECHGIRMSSATHDFEHHTYGARYQSGFDIEGLSAGNDTYTQVTSGGFRDEDILHMVDAIASAPFIYRLGTTGEWWRTLPDLNIGHNAGGTYDVWNEDTGTTWQLTEGTNSTDYFITFLIEKPSITGSNLNKIISQGTYSSANRARGAIESEQSKLVLNGLPSPEFVFIGAIIVNRDGELQLLSDGSLYYDLRVQKGGSGAVGSSGEANTTSNAGTGVGIALSKVGTDLPMASFTSAGGTVDISLDGDNLNLETIGTSSNATIFQGVEAFDGESWAAIGDSNTSGPDNTVPANYSWVQKLSELTGNTFCYNMGRGGGTTQDMIDDSLPRVLLNDKVQHVTLMSGTNDVSAGYTVQETFDLQQIIIKALQAVGKVVYQFYTIPPADPLKTAWIEELNAKVAEESAANVIVDTYTPLELDGVLNPLYQIGTEVHLNTDGMNLFASTVYPHMLFKYPLSSVRRVSDLATVSDTNLLGGSASDLSLWDSYFLESLVTGELAPDGTNTAYGLVATTDNTSGHRLSESIGGFTIGEYVYYTAWAKSGDVDFFRLRGAGVEVSLQINLTTAACGPDFDFTGTDLDEQWECGCIPNLYNGFSFVWVKAKATAEVITMVMQPAEQLSEFAGDGATINTTVWQPNLSRELYPPANVLTEDYDSTDSVVNKSGIEGDNLSEALDSLFNGNANEMQDITVEDPGQTEDLNSPTRTIPVTNKVPTLISRQNYASYPTEIRAGFLAAYYSQTRITDVTSSGQNDIDGNEYGGIVGNTDTSVHQLTFACDFESIVGNFCLRALAGTIDWICLRNATSGEETFVDLVNKTVGVTSANCVATVTENANGDRDVCFDHNPVVGTNSLQVRLAEGDNDDTVTGDDSAIQTLITRVHARTGLVSDDIGFADGGDEAVPTTQAIEWISTT